MPFISDFLADVRFGLRALRRTPGFAAVAILSLGVGIGATTTMFAALDTFLLHSPPQLDGIVAVTLRSSGQIEQPPSPVEFEIWRDAVDPIPLAAYASEGFNLIGDGTAERVSGARVTE